MFTLNSLIFFFGILLFLGIVSSKLSARIGMPVLVLFLAVGMLAGSEGLGGIAFEDYPLANSIGSAALALILFDGGLRTSVRAIRTALAPALALATAGVALTALLTGLVAAWVLQIPLWHGILLGSIVGSTDAAAVFSILRTSRLKLPARLSGTLELESGSNDPMAIFLTLGIIGILTHQMTTATDLAWLLVLQFGAGALSGLLLGFVAVRIINRIHFDHPGLYPTLALSFGLLSFGLAAVVGGSGFLAVYLCGIVMGNSQLVFRNGILLFHDASAWISQILLFVMLGLLSFPSHLPQVAVAGVMIACGLTFVARPLAVFLTLLPFRFSLREALFISWVGLKGAVPITLATYPLMAGIDNSEQLFNVVFFVVLVSAVTQGWSLPLVARWLGLALPAEPVTPVSLEINALRHVDGEIVQYSIEEGTTIAGTALQSLALPDGVVITLIVRDNQVIFPRGGSQILVGDHLFVALRRRLKPLVDAFFGGGPTRSPLVADFVLDFPATARVPQICHFLGLPSQGWPDVRIRTLLPTTERPNGPRLGPWQVRPAITPDLVRLAYKGFDPQAADF